MFFLLLVAASILVARARGGAFSHLAQIRFRWSGLILLGLLLQIAIFNSVWQTNSTLQPFSSTAYLGSLTLLLIALARNDSLPGIKIISFGFALNFLAIAANGGYMPATSDARAFAGQPILKSGEVRNNSIGAGSDTRLIFLTDIFAIPKGIPFPNVFSIGDVLIAIGAAYLFQKGMRQSAPP